MSRMNGNKEIHNNLLMPSTVDEIELCKAVHNGFLTCCELYQKEHQMNLVPPQSLENDIFKWRTMSVRHRNGDIRHTEAEYESLKVIAQWTIDVNCKLRGQDPKKVVWK